VRLVSFELYFSRHLRALFPQGKLPDPDAPETQRR